MKLIRINDNSKGGPCCSASIDATIGCRNKCSGCYAIKSARMGKSFFKDIPIEKEYNETILKKDCNKYKKNGISVIRLGKFSDPGDPAIRGTINKILDLSTREKIKIIFVTKSLEPDQETASLMLAGDHVFHFSLGMKSKINEQNILRSYNFYKNFGIRSFLRITHDITSKKPSRYIGLHHNKVILTPMRFASKKEAEELGVNLSNYKFENGFYRPYHMDNSWLGFTKNICGEVDGRVFCCNCGIQRIGFGG